MEHSIESVMGTTLKHIKEMVDVNTVIGNPITTNQNCTIIPVSKVGFGFGVGGGEYERDKHEREKAYPFAGGSGAGISITPIGFLVVKQEGISMLPANSESPVDRIVEMLPNVIGCVNNILSGNEKECKQRCEANEGGQIHY